MITKFICDKCSGSFEGKPDNIDEDGFCTCIQCINEDKIKFAEHEARDIMIKAFEKLGLSVPETYLLSLEND